MSFANCQSILIVEIDGGLGVVISFESAQSFFVGVDTTIEGDRAVLRRLARKRDDDDDDDDDEDDD